MWIRRSRKQRSFFFIEPLEERRLLSGLGGGTVTVAPGVLEVVGTGRHDAIKLEFWEDGVVVIINGRKRFVPAEVKGESITSVKVEGLHGHDQIWVRTIGARDVGQSVTVLGGAGNDTIVTATATIPMTVDGGNGADYMNAGRRNEYADLEFQIGTLMVGGNGRDSMVTSSGDDTVFGGASNDTIVTGMGEDAVFGEGGNDVIIFEEPQDGGSAFDGGDGDDLLVTPDGKPEDVVLTSIERVVAGSAKKFLSH